jgi:hypothetical protein
MRNFVVVVALVTLCAFVLASSAAADPSEYGFESVAASESTYQAGGHPDFTTTFALKANSGGEPFATTRNLDVELPPGLIGNPSAYPPCTNAQFQSLSCPTASQVGIAHVSVFGFFPVFEPIYLLKPPSEDVVARLAFVAFQFPTYVDIHVRSESDYGLTASLTGLSGVGRIKEATTTLWGVPSATAHDTERITPIEGLFGQFPLETPRPSGLAPTVFMTNPTTCGAPQQVGFRSDTYALPGLVATAIAPLPVISGCEKLGFEPSLSATPTTRAAASPSGLDVDLSIPQNEEVNGVATSELRDATIALPKGMTLAAGATDGLEACSAQEVGYKVSPPPAAHCPDASKIGTVEFDAPALSRTLQGSVYQRTPEAGNLFRIWLVADELGVHVKIPGDIHLDPETGQVTTLFVDNPQIPVRQLKLHFKGGPRGVLATPSSCGTYSTHYEFIPWSGNGAVSGEAPMTIDQGCATGGFRPKLAAGTTNPTAGRFSPLAVDLTRTSREQNLAELEVEMPPGLLAKLAGVDLCSQGQAANAACPASSQVGTTTIAAGPGTSPLWIPQPGKAPTAIYLAGPYKGEPYSLVVRTPGQAGPFDLGTVVVRAAIDVDPESTEVTVKSDPLPQFLQGVPVSYRTLHLDINRPDFSLNPTSCDPMAVKASLRSVAGAIAKPSDRFQVGSCGQLAFKPRLSLRLRGKTHRGGFPGLRATLKMPKGANIARAAVALPHSEFLEQAHIGTVCTRVQFAVRSCPEASVYGRAKAVTPLLDEPLEGPVYLRSSSHELPDLVADLRGQIDVVLDGRIDSVNGGIRTVFSSVPDAPVSRFTLTMRGGSKGLLVNSTALCHAPHRAVAKFRGHNGRTRVMHPLLKAACAR